MGPKARLVAEIEAAIRMAAEDVHGALLRLRDLAADPDRNLLGPPTLLGLPRKLHSARLKVAKTAGDTAGRLGLQASAMPPPDLLAPLFAVSAAERRALTEAARRSVPKLLHQIWIGGPAPVSCAAWAAHAGRHGWRYRLWDEAQLAAAGVAHDPLYRAMRQAGDLPGAVDVARYHVLSREGGVYLDCDWYPARDDVPMEAALPMLGLAALAEPAPRVTSTGSLLVTNALIAAPPQHPVFARLIAALPAVARSLPDGPAWWVTGPLPFTLAARGGPMSLLDAGLVAAVLPRRAPMAEVEAIRARTAAADAPGLLIGWKSW